MKRQLVRPMRSDSLPERSAYGMAFLIGLDELSELLIIRGPDLEM